MANPDDARGNRRLRSSLGDLFDKRRYSAHVHQLQKEPSAWIATEDLIEALVANSKEPIPELLLAHLRQRLDGIAKKPRGRKKKVAGLREYLVPVYYERYLRWLQNRKKTHGLKGWSCIQSAKWWKGPRRPASGQRGWSRRAS
jgi:hypothetical protein